MRSITLSIIDVLQLQEDMNYESIELIGVGRAGPVIATRRRPTRSAAADLLIQINKNGSAGRT